MVRWLLIVLLGWMGVAFGCTDFVVEAADGTRVNGRSLEFATELESQVKVFPRGRRVVSMSSDEKPGVEWVSKYGYVGVTCLGQDFSMDGLNEKGLSFGLLWLPGTEYPTIAKTELRRGLDFVDLGAWILGNFCNVAQVKEGLKKVRVWGHPVPPLPGIPPVHVAVHDVDGNSLVIEFVKGQMKVYDNPNSVLTNSPPFDWQIVNLSNYLNLSAENAAPVERYGYTLNPPGQGSGLLGIPGDWSPPSRFVRMSTYLRFAKEVADAEGAVILTQHLLNAVDIPLGEIRAQNGEEDYTQWTVVKDLTNRVFYFRSYNDLTLKKIDLNRLNFEAGAMSKSVPIDLNKGYINITSTF